MRRNYFLLCMLSVSLFGCSSLAANDNHFDAGDAVSLVLDDIRNAENELPNELEIRVDDVQDTYIVSVLFKPIISYGGSLKYTVDKNKKMITLRLVEP